jgi:hypothetical protein
MAIHCSLVEQGHNRLRYLLTTDSESGGTQVITTTGAASPDLLTDSLNGPIRECAEAFTDGIGILPPGALTQAQARAIWMADNSDVVLGNAKVPRVICYLEARSGSTGVVWLADADVDGSGHPVINVTANNASAPASAYLTVKKQGGVGL